MDFFAQLGVDSTIWVQLTTFLVFLGVYYFFVFIPYTRALEGREDATTGGIEQSEAMEKESAELNNQWLEKNKILDKEQADIFATRKKEAKEQSEKILANARYQAETEMDNQVKAMTEQVQNVKKELQKEIPDIVSLVKKKLVS